MKNIIIFLFVVFAVNAFAVCTTPISRTNFGPFQVLSSSALNADLNNAYAKINELPGDCITNLTVTTAKIADSAITTAKISNGAITSAKLAAVNAVTSSGSGSFSTMSASFVDVTNLSVTITTTGRPIVIQLISETGQIGGIGASRASGTFAAAIFRMLRDATEIGQSTVTIQGASGVLTNTVPPGSIFYYDTPAAGTYTYKLQISADSGSAYVNYARLIAREL